MLLNNYICLFFSKTSPLPAPKEADLWKLILAYSFFNIIGVISGI